MLVMFVREKFYVKEDPQAVVIDEALSYLTTLLFYKSSRL